MQSNGALRVDRNTNYLGLPATGQQEQVYRDDISFVTARQTDQGRNATSQDVIHRLANDDNLVTCNRTGVMSLQQHRIWDDYVLPAQDRVTHLSQMSTMGSLPPTPPRFCDRLAVLASTTTRAEMEGRPVMLQQQNVRMELEGRSVAMQPQNMMPQSMLHQQVDMTQQMGSVATGHQMGPMHRSEILQATGWYGVLSGDEAQVRGRSRERRSPYERRDRRGSKERWAQDVQIRERNRDRSGESSPFSSLSRSPVAHDGNERRVTSGIHDKLSSKVRTKLTWPQKQLKFAFISESIEFRSLTFEHFVAGEVMTIRSCKNEVERDNRLRLLERICYWKIKGADWGQLRAFYAAFLSGVESHEHNWEEPLHELESMMIDRPALSAMIKPDKRLKGIYNKWFCKEYNSMKGCTLTSGHKVNVKGEDREAIHMCAKCWENSKQVKKHPRCVEECPYYKK